MLGMRRPESGPAPHSILAAADFAQAAQPLVRAGRPNGLEMLGLAAVLIVAAALRLVSESSESPSRSSMRVPRRSFSDGRISAQRAAVTTTCPRDRLTFWAHNAQLGKARQGEARRGEARQGKARLDEVHSDMKGTSHD